MRRISFHNSRQRSPYRGQGLVLNALKSRQEISQKALAEQLDVSKQALAELLAKLEKSGYITRQPSEADRRVLTVRLTDAGTRAADEAAHDFAQLTGLLDCLDGEELVAFSRSLKKIVESQNARCPVCFNCKGPAYCVKDYLKYGHDRPNPDYCKFIWGASHDTEDEP